MKEQKKTRLVFQLFQMEFMDDKKVAHEFGVCEGFSEMNLALDLEATLLFYVFDITIRLISAIIA